jgi:hypothetical protein
MLGDAVGKVFGEVDCVDTVELVTTGVPGRDHILHGGLLRRGFYLIQGKKLMRDSRRPQ